MGADQPDGARVAFHKQSMTALIHALYESIVRLQPEFGPWPGVIVDPERPVPWHLIPPTETAR